VRGKFVFFIVLLPALLIAQAEKKQDVWESFKFFEGKWEGKGEGKSGISNVMHEFHFVLNGKYLRMETKAVFEPQEKNPKGEIHEDIGFFSYDRIREKYVFRQFHVEGFINQYTLDSISEDGKSFTFVSEQIENGPPGLRARLMFDILDDDDLRVSFHLAFPGREFDCYSINTLKRKR